ncbi:MAG: hypothetical protein AAGG81_04470, partial [Chlamydiota bacterium]
MERAEIYFEAGDYERALTIYKELLSNEKESWKKSILEYNIATVLLEKGEVEEAIKNYSGIPQERNTFPLIVVSINTNLAIARWRVAKEVVQKMVSGQTYYEEDYLKAVFILNRALNDVRKASQAYCRQLIEEGDDICTPSYSLNMLRDALQQQLAVVEVQHLKKSLETVNPKDGVPLMLAGFYAIKLEVVQLLSISMSEEIKNEQVDRIIDQAVTWVNLWNALGERVDNNELYFQAKKDYLSFLEYLKEGDLNKSLVSIKSSEKTLNEYMGVLYDQDAVLEFVKKLLISYEKAELMVPLQEAYLSSIKDQQTTILSILAEKNVDTTILEEASTYLQSSVNYAKRGKFKSARVYLTLAYQQVKRFKWIVEIKQTPTVEQFLEQLIYEQMASILVNYTIVQVQTEKDITESGHEIHSQELSLNFASNFWKLAIHEQKTNYYKPLEEGEDLKTRCLYQPWTQVIELFDDGYYEAQKALNILKGAGDKQRALIHQDTAMRFWRDALEKLKTIPP